MSLGLGIIGGGQIVRWRIADLLRSGRWRMAGLADPDPQTRETIRREFGLESIHADYRRLLEGDAVEVIYLCVPHHLHCPLALEALHRGKHVICEKPLALNAAEARRMQAAAQRAGKRLFVAENFRYLSANRAMRKVLEAGALGQVFLCLSCFIGDEYQRMSDPVSWKGDPNKSGGGVIIDNGPHVIDTLCSFFGRVESVQAFAERGVITCPTKAEDTACLTLRLTGGVLANIALTFVARQNLFPAGYGGAGLRYDIYGVGGSLHMVNERGDPVTLVRNGRHETIPQPPALNMMEHFAQCLESGAEPLVTAQDGLHVMEVIDACYESIRTGRTVDIPVLGAGKRLQGTGERRPLLVGNA